MPEPWSIQVIITRPIYVGYYSWKGELYKGNYEPLVSVEDYNKVQRILAQQGKVYGRHRLQKLNKLK